jgi:hypothetical protein
MKEKQAYPRTRGRIQVRFGVEALDRTAFTNNISATGAFIRTNNVLAPGTTLKVEFSFDTPVEVHARVVWAKKVPAPGPEWFKNFESWEASKGPR